MATSFIPSKPMASEIRSDPIPNSRLFTGIEASLLLVAFGVLWAALYWFAKGGPVSTDVLYYFQLGQLRIADPFVLNRYFHILFQKLFVDLSANPLAGIQSLWAFLTSLSTVGVYLIARLATRRSTQLHGLMAVAIFFSLPSLPIVAGVTHVDLMTMTMSVLLVVLYIFSLNKKHDNKALLIALGVVTFLGLKTKENFISSTVVSIQKKLL